MYFLSLIAVELFSQTRGFTQDIITLLMTLLDQQDRIESMPRKKLLSMMLIPFSDHQSLTVVLRFPALVLIHSLLKYSPAFRAKPKVVRDKTLKERIHG